MFTKSFRRLGKRMLSIILVLLLITGLMPMSASADVIDDIRNKPLKILAIGNSFSEDATSWIYDIAKSAGIKTVIVANIYIGGCSLNTHWNNAKTNAAVYEYWKNSDGTWLRQSGKTMQQGLEDEYWDVITLQQSSPYSGMPDTYNSDLDNLITYVKSKMKNPNAQLYWHMTWAYAQNSASVEFARYHNDQMEMYNAIVNTVQDKIVPNSAFSGIIPVGTAIQNVRTSYIGDTLNRDDLHLTLNLGRYIAGLTWFQKITGMSLNYVTFNPDSTVIPAKHVTAINEAINNAIAKPFEVTDSSYPNDPDGPQIPINFNDYTLVDWQPLGSSYWNSMAPVGSFLQNSVTAPNATNLKYFISSKQFTKAELPVGSIIVLDAGYQYRPEGWIDINASMTSRPNNETANMVTITDAWWGNYTVRAFNLSVVGLTTDISGAVAETAAHLKIYVPKYPNYRLVNWFPKTSSYWNSMADPAIGFLQSSANSTATNLVNFISSKQFSKSELPNGTLIIIDKGYQYRPEGWINLTSAQTSRPNNVVAGDPETIITVDDTWWGSYTVRAFNVAVQGASTDISNAVLDTAMHFRIYVTKVITKDYSSASSVSATLKNPVKSDGLTLVTKSDGNPIAVTQDGVSCLKTDKANGNINMYFDVDNTYMNGGSNEVQVDVVYYNDGTGMFGIGYDGSGATNGTQGVLLGDTNAWKTASFVINDAEFNGELNGADFCIGLNNSVMGDVTATGNDIYIRSVTLKKHVHYSSGVNAVFGVIKTYNGLTLEQVDEDGRPVDDVLDNVDCIRTDAASGQDSMYFDVEDAYIMGGTNEVDVEIEYYDGDVGKFALTYDNEGNPNSTDVIELTGTNKWIKTNLRISNAKFSNGLADGSDFKIGLADGSTDDIYIRSVTVNRAAVSAILGETTAQYNGLTLVRMGDGDPVNATAGGVECFRTDKNTTATIKNIYMYFDVADSFINGGTNDVEIEVEYYNDTPAKFGIGYDGAGGISGTNGFTMTATTNPVWLKTIFRLTDAKFANGLNNVDFRVGLYTSRMGEAAATDKDIYIRSVTVRKVQAQALDPVTVGISSAKVGNIFTQADQMTLNLNLINTTKSLQTLRVDYSVKNEKGAIVKSGAVNDIAVSAASSKTVNLDLNDITLYGLYTISIEAYQADKGISVKGEYPFSRVLSENRNADDGIFGACTHFAQNKGSIEGNLTEAQQAGVKYIRDEMYWGNAEKVKGQLQILPSWNTYVDTALAKGIEPFVVLSYGNGLYSNGAVPTSDADIAAYANYCKFIATQFKDKVTHFEIWNEYNINVVCGRGGPEDGASYKKLLEAAYNAIKSVYPGEEDKVTVVGCATAETDLEFIKEALDAGGYDFMDAISIHPYSYPFSPDSSGLESNISQLDNLVKQYGAHKPIWITEIGWPTNTSVRGVSEYYSAVYAVKAHVLSSIGNFVDKVFWYDFQDDGTDVNYTEDNFGLIKTWSGVTVPGAAKKNYVAYSAMTSKLHGMKYDTSYNNLDQSLKIYRFTSENSGSGASDKLVLWTTGAEKTVALDLGCASVDVSDMYGNKQTVYAVDGKVNLSLSEAPVYVEGAIAGTVSLAASALQLEKTAYNAIKGDTIQVNADFNGTVPPEGAKYSIVLPNGWDSVQDVAFTTGDTAKQIVIKLPDDLAKGTYQFDVLALKNDGGLIGSLKATVNIVDPYSVKVIPVPTQKGQWLNWSVRAEITNNLDTSSLEGTIKLTAPAEWASSDIDFGVNPRSTKIVDIPVPGTVDQGLHDVTVDIVVDGAGEYIIQKKISFLGAQKTEAAPEIDGVIDNNEWSGAMEFKLDNPLQVVNYADYSGIDDLSATGYLKWDSNKLYMAVNVKDDVHFQDKTGGNIWNGDGIQFAIDPQRLSATKATAWNEIGMALNNTSEVYTYRWSAISGRTTGAMPNMNCTIVRDENAKTTIYEASIPCTDILPDGQTVGEGSDIGFSLLVNDSDGTGRGWIEYMSGIGLAKDPGLFGDLVMVASLNTDATLSSIKANGIQIKGFASDILEYKVVLPNNTKKVPAVTVEAADSNAGVVVTAATKIPGTTVIVVTAEDGKTVMTYKVNFTLEKYLSKDASLSDIKVDGKAIPGFDSKKYHYEVTLPHGTTTVPEVTATVNDSYAKAVVTACKKLPGTSRIVVTAEDGKTKRVYTITFKVVKSNDATLKEILVNGVALEGFSPEKDTYKVILPAGTKVAPKVTVKTNDDNAKVLVLPSLRVPGIAIIQVIAEDLKTIKTYKIYFSTK